MLIHLCAKNQRRTKGFPKNFKRFISVRNQVFGLVDFDTNASRKGEWKEGLNASSAIIKYQVDTNQKAL
jgi:hypothetical protein